MTDFGAGRIDPTKWLGIEHVTAYARTRTLEGGWHNQVEDEATSAPRLSVADGVAIREVVNGARVEINPGGCTGPVTERAHAGRRIDARFDRVRLAVSGD